MQQYMQQKNSAKSPAEGLSYRCVLLPLNSIVFERWVRNYLHLLGVWRGKRDSEWPKEDQFLSLRHIRQPKA